MKNLRAIIKRPVITEKSTIERETNNIVTFAVALNANKVEIKSAIEELFDVTVLEVRTSHMLGKMRRVGAKSGRKPSWKKARVSLREGDSIEFFAGV
ncbi:MAG: 50S ribosomal protein L23 [Deltaproteobacteria bacterium]|nr:50S ribosomal protein L23 [Deltaproteobacteria bacterium]